MLKIELSFAIIFLSLSAQAVDMTKSTEISTSSFEVPAARYENLSNVVIDSQVSIGRGPWTRVTMHLSCYATNLRAIGNPVATNTLITAIFDAYDSSHTLKNFKLQFPSEYLKPPSARQNIYPDQTYEDMVKFTSIPTSPKPGAIKAYDNIIQFLVQEMYQVGSTASGEVNNLSANNLTISGVRFTQSGAPGIGSYFGSDGPLSSSINWYTSKDGRVINIYASFPGAANPGQGPVYLGETRTGFCGGFYSPLMLFFDKNLPQFTGQSQFPLIKNYPWVYWPEANAPGYFLTLDKNKNSKIDDASELFGDTEKFVNGFKNLASYDDNKDGVIDAKDKIFKQLRLWNNKKGDGISRPQDMFTLKQMGVEKIVLKYEPETKMFGDRAHYSEKSYFVFTKNGKKIKGDVFDIWFSPAGSGSLANK